MTLEGRKNKNIILPSEPSVPSSLPKWSRDILKAGQGESEQEQGLAHGLKDAHIQQQLHRYLSGFVSGIKGDIPWATRIQLSLGRG